MENKSNAFRPAFSRWARHPGGVRHLLVQQRPHRARAVRLVTRSTVNGLGPQADVKYRGPDVGKVVSIKFDPEVSGQIIVRISVDHDTPITGTTYATLGLQGVTGVAYVQLDDTAARTGAGPQAGRPPPRPRRWRASPCGPASSRSWSGAATRC